MNIEDNQYESELFEILPADLATAIYQNDEEIGQAVADYVNGEYLAGLETEQAPIIEDIQRSIKSGDWQRLKTRTDFLVLTTSLSRLVGTTP